MHLKKLLVLCRRRVRKGSWCRDLTLASRLSAQLIWARCTGACFLPVRSPCAPRMHFWACLEICDHQLSRSRETKYTGEKNKIKQINKKNPTPPPHHPFKTDFVQQNLPVSLGKQACEEHYYQCWQLSSVCFCISTELPSPEQLSPTEGSQGI